MGISATPSTVRPAAMETEAKTEAAGAIVKHSLAIAGHRTSVSLEQAFWDGLKSIAAERGLSLATLAAEIDAERGAANLSSAIRVFVLNWTRSSH
jgi:predicted DNA-binding ribbon-helix-helix protein